MSAVGFYGDNIHFQAASKGGWDSLGLQRVVTKSQDNVLYELDDKTALEIYKCYLGKKEDKQEAQVRTVLAIDEVSNSITFAGDIPQDSQLFV